MRNRAWARLPVRVEHRLERLDPLLRWLAVDGYGFHQGYFHWQRFINGQTRPRLRGYALRAVDQGLGRSVWFVNGASAEQIVETMRAFDENRRSDLWGGVGLACGYAGGVSGTTIEKLKVSAGVNLPEFAQGVAFAAKARERAGNPSPFNELACRLVWGQTASDVARRTDSALIDLPPDQRVPAYEVWRQRVQSQFTLCLRDQQAAVNHSTEEVA